MKYCNYCSKSQNDHMFRNEQMKQHLNRLRDFGSDVDSDYYELCEQYLTNTT